ncbi:MAG: hypothetical protein FWG56_10590 [Desulfovibrionaceae bacterium]|jgi:hypothetical protein|nr:hypothetical protein [Desulfovibrionaceae bacterium]
MKNLSILIPDNLHINKRNFPSFFDFTEREKAKVHFETRRRDWIGLYGDYASKLPVLQEKIEVLNRLSPEDLMAYNVKGANLFKISRAEILAYVAVGAGWYDAAYPRTLVEIFQKLNSCNRMTLLQNMAAAWDWIIFWRNMLSDFPQFTHACIFSGSLIYQKSLIRVLSFTSTKCMLMESSFTGNDFYCEEKYEHIANNCDIRHEAVFRAISVADNEWGVEREKIKAINKILLSKNKNVTQPVQGSPIIFKNKNFPIVTILGQVINDFSLLEYRNIGLSSIHFYKQLISDLLEVDCNIVFKSHPWESKKDNVKKSLTKDELTNWMLSFPEEAQEKILFVDNYPIENLFKCSSWVAGINSQGLLEAAFHGLKPVQFGNAFFGEKGFTHDYELNDTKGFLEKIKIESRSISATKEGTMTLAEFDAFESFCTKLLQFQLVSIHNSGLMTLRRIFADEDVIALVKKGAANPTATKVIVPNRPISLSAKEGVKPSATKSATKDSSLPLASAAKRSSSSALAVASAENNNSDLALGKVKSPSSFERKVKKFKVYPRKFFSDSSNPYVRWMRIFFKYKQ